MPQTLQMFSNGMISQVKVGEEGQEGRRKARNEGSYPTQAAIILYGSQAVTRLFLIAVTMTRAVPGQKESSCPEALEAGEELTISSDIFQSRNLILWNQEALQGTSSYIKLFQEAKKAVSHSGEVLQLVPPLPKQRELWAIAALYKPLCTQQSSHIQSRNDAFIPL